jgi:hypothetical protein
MKRAESHWWKQASDIPFAVTPSGDGYADLDNVPIAVDGQFKIIDPSSLDGMGPDEVERYMAGVAQSEELAKANEAKTPEQRKAAADAGSEDLFGPKPTEPTPRSWSEAFVARTRTLFEDNGIVPPDVAPKHLIMLLNLSPFDETWADDAMVRWGKNYRGARDQDVPSKVAATMATAATAPF